MTRLPPPARTLVALPVWFDVACESFKARTGPTRASSWNARRRRPSRSGWTRTRMWLAVGNLLNNAAQAALERPRGPVHRRSCRPSPRPDRGGQRAGDARSRRRRSSCRSTRQSPRGRASA
ncbi:hypothetical protein ACRAWD_06385 [Caulobacter segnis]